MREAIARLTRDKDEALILARVLDLAEQTSRRGYLAGDFLEPHLQAMASRLLTHQNELFISWQGGYEGAERCRLLLHTPGVVPDRSIAIIQIKAELELRHRDCLGSLLGLGLRREKLGDLIPAGASCYAVVARELADFIVKDLLQVGRQQVEVTRVDDLSDLAVAAPKILTATVASLRLDAVIAAGFGLSRAEAQKLIEGEKVKLNYQETLRSESRLKEGDLVSVRGYGRLKLTGLSGKSRKDRQRVTLERY